MGRRYVNDCEFWCWARFWASMGLWPTTIPETINIKWCDYYILFSYNLLFLPHSPFQILSLSLSITRDKGVHIWYIDIWSNMHLLMPLYFSKFKQSSSRSIYQRMVWATWIWTWKVRHWSAPSVKSKQSRNQQTHQIHCQSSGARNRMEYSKGEIRRTKHYP